MGDLINVLMITIDCLRPDHLGCFGYKEISTPNLDNLSKEGCLFTQAIANGPSTPASFPSILTSTYPLMYRDYPKICKPRILISEVLRESGYKTAGFHSNPYLSRFYNYHGGFDYFKDFLESDSYEDSGEKNIRRKIKDTVRKNEKIFAFAKNIYAMKENIKASIKPLVIPYQRTETINNKAISWLEKNKDGFFLWLHYMDTHHPFYPPEQFCDYNIDQIKQAEHLFKNPDSISSKALRNIVNLYDGAIRYVDYALGLFFQRLKEMGIYENSLIIITADHGEEFKEHGGLSHMAKVYDELIHVPLFIKGPELPTNFKVDEPVSLLDLAPTILDYLGLPQFKNFMGQSLIPLVAGGGEKYNKEGIISETLIKGGRVSLSIDEGYRVTSYRTNEWKYIHNEESDQHELYNLKEDPKEIKNLYHIELEKRKEFESKLMKHILMEETTRDLSHERGKIDKLVKGLKKAGKI